MINVREIIGKTGFQKLMAVAAFLMTLALIACLSHTQAFASESTSTVDESGSAAASVQSAPDEAASSGASTSKKVSVTKAKPYFKEGTYKISSSANSRKVQVRAKKTSAGAQIVLRKNNTTNCQKWYISHSSGSYGGFRIQSVQSGRYITAKDDKVVEAKYSKGANQIWTARSKSGSVIFTNKGTGKILNATSKTGLSLVEEGEEIAKSQLFKTAKASILPEGTYYIQTKSSKRVLGVTGKLTRSGSNVNLLSRSSASNKKWTATLNSDGTYTFRNAYSARVLAVKGSSARRGANVYQGSLSSSKAKKWKLSLSKNGGINIKSALNSNTCLGSASLRSGSNSKMIKSTVAKSAVFTFKKASKPSSRAKMERKIRNKSSKTGWLLVANTKSCFVGVYKGSKGKWTPYAYFPCSPGAPGSQSRKGTYRVGLKGYAFGSDSYTCYYYTQYSGNYLFHSILYNHGTFTVQDGRMGMHISHGCIRLELVNAKWINRNIPVGTTVYVY